MKKNNLNLFYQGCIAFIIFVLLGTQIFSMVFNTKTTQGVLLKNEQKISEILAAGSPPATIHENKFDFALPVGTQLYAKTDTNLKLRFESAYYNIHILTSHLNLESYAKSNFPTATSQTISTPQNERILVYSEELSSHYTSVGIYGNGTEITFIVPSTSLEPMILKGIEVLRNIQLKDFEDEAIFIGSGKDNSAQTVLDQNADANVEGDDADETEIEIKI